MIKTKKNKKNTPQTQIIISELLKPVNHTKYLYLTNKFNINKLYRNENFISNILDQLISEIFEKLDNVRFTFKYQIYGKPEHQPSFLFHKKNELKKYMLFEKDNLDDYGNDTFGIRLEFIDPDSNRYIYIITIE